MQSGHRDFAGIEIAFGNPLVELVVLFALVSRFEDKRLLAKCAEHAQNQLKKSQDRDGQQRHQEEEDVFFSAIHREVFGFGDRIYSGFD